MKPNRMFLQKGSQGEAFDKVVKFCKPLGVAVEWAERAALDRRCDKGVHNGLVALFPEYQYAVLERVLEQAGPGLIVVLDQVEDPRNLGAVVRSAEVHGARAVVIPKDRAADMTPAAEKTSAGAASRVAVAQVTNLAQALEAIQKAGYWVYGLAAEAETFIDAEKYPERTCLVLGSEGQGLRDRTHKICDKLVSIRQLGEVGSLNVSVAAGIAMYEVIRQRQDRIL
jgi:23S rRNA (guanosine2251-2'-O)-methyltransferase